MRLSTASEIISFARKLDEDSARFYEELAQRYSGAKETLLSFAKENRKDIVQVERAYYGVITDALEGCFAFDIDPDEYSFETELPQNSSYSDAIKKAVNMEEKIIRFYNDAATQSKSLMADVPRTLALIAKKRSGRSTKLNSLLSPD